LRYWVLFIFWYPGVVWHTARISYNLSLASIPDRSIESRRQSCLRAAEILDSPNFRVTIAAQIRLTRYRYGRKAAHDTRKMLQELRESLWAVAQALRA